MKECKESRIIAMIWAYCVAYVLGIVVTMKQGNPEIWWLLGMFGAILSFEIIEWTGQTITKRKEKRRQQKTEKNYRKMMDDIKEGRI